MWLLSLRGILRTGHFDLQLGGDYFLSRSYLGYFIPWLFHIVKYLLEQNL